jgi:hypothetical protein
MLTDERLKEVADLRVVLPIKEAAELAYELIVAHQRIAELEAENRELREGLKYYARPDNYGIGGGNINKIICDAGKVAKALLEKYPQRKDGTK